MEFINQTKLSFFGDFYDNKPIIRTLSDVYELAMSESVKRQTLEIRRLRGIADDEETSIGMAIEAKTNADKVKKKLPSFMTNVLCEHGKTRKNIVSFLPFIGFDVDHITEADVENLMQKLADDPHVVLAEPSCSRSGVHFVLFTDAHNWLNSHWNGKDTKPYEFVWSQAKAYVDSKYHIVIDENCKNPEHIFGICYDELIHFKEQPNALHIDTDGYKEPKPKTFPTFNTNTPTDTYWANLNNNDKAATPIESTSSIEVRPADPAPDDIKSQVTDLTQIIVERGIDITAGYGNWLKLGFALSDGLGEEGRDLYHSLSRMNADYDPAGCDRQYDACLHSHGQGVTIKTFFQMAKDAGLDLSAFAKAHGAPQSVSSGVCAKNANVPNDTDTEKEEKTPVSCHCETEWHDGTVAQMAQSEPMLPGNGKTFCDKIDRNEWPDFCLPILDSQNDIVGQDKMMLGSLNLISGLLPKTLYSIYDRRRIYAPLYNILYGGFATKKGDLEACKQLVVPVKNEMRRAFEAQKCDYEQELAAWENAPKGGRGPAPVEPVMRTPFVAANSSASAIYRTLDANEDWGLMFETEADTLTNMLSKSEYGDYSDLLRKAHHHECSTMVRVSEHLNIEIEEPRFSVLLTCTGSQLPLLLPANNVANGLASRFLFYALPDSKVEFRNVFEGNDTPIEDTYKQLGQKLLLLYHALLNRESHPIQFLMTHQQQKEFVSTFNDVLKEQFAMLGNGIQGFIFRLALECYRYAMVLTALRRLSERYDSDDGLFDDDEQALVCDDRDFRIAMTIIDCLVNHTARVYAVIGGSDDDPFAKAPAKPSAELKAYFLALPEGREFKTAEAMEIAAKQGIPERTAKRLLGDMVNHFLVLDHPHHGSYQKSRKEE